MEVTNLKKWFTGKAARSAVVASLTMAAGTSQAAVDTGPLVSALGDAGAAVGVIGAAVLGVVVIVKTFKYIRSAF